MSSVYPWSYYISSGSIAPTFLCGIALGFAEFAEALQNGLADSLKDRPKKVDVKLFVDRILTNANGDEVKVTEDLANAIYEDLIQSGYVKRGELTDR